MYTKVLFLQQCEHDFSNFNELPINQRVTNKKWSLSKILFPTNREGWCNFSSPYMRSIQVWFVGLSLGFYTMTGQPNKLNKPLKTSIPIKPTGVVKTDAPAAPNGPCDPSQLPTASHSLPHPLMNPHGRLYPVVARHKHTRRASWRCIRHLIINLLHPLDTWSRHVTF